MQGTPFTQARSARSKAPGSATGTERIAAVPDITPQVPVVTTSTSAAETSAPSRMRRLNSAAV